jgi:excinuclease UvrABC ATPase subunit
VVAEGTPEQVARVVASHTGRYLQKTLRLDPPAKKKAQRGRPAASVSSGLAGE